MATCAKCKKSKCGCELIKGVCSSCREKEKKSNNH